MVPNLMIFQLYDGAKRFALGRNRTLNFDLFPLAVRSAVLSCDAGPSSECSSQAACDRSGDEPQGPDGRSAFHLSAVFHPSHATASASL